MPPEADGRWRLTQSVPFKTKDLFDRGNANKVTDTRGLFVIHAIHLHTSKVLWFCGHAEYLLYPQTSYVFDPRKPGDPPKEAKVPPGLDLFCCHYVQIPDGRILVVGGSQIDRHHATTFASGRDYRGSRGASTIAIFDPRKKTKQWSKVGSLLQGRWYPTAVTLGDGSVLVISGRREDVELTWTIPQAEELLNNHHIANKVEHLLAPTYGKPVNLAGAEKAIPIYPGIHLAPDDRLWTTHTTWGQEIPEPGTLALTVVPAPSGSPKGTTATGTWTEFTLVDHKARQPEREEGMSVMLPVLLDPVTKARSSDTLGRFLVIGGGFAVDHDGVSPVQQADRGPAPTFVFVTRPGLGTLSFDRQVIATPEPAEILDVTAGHGPVWSKAPGTLQRPRINGHCVLLPDATVAILGGHDNYKWHASTNTALAQSPPASPAPATPPTPPTSPTASPPPAKTVPMTRPTLEVEIFTPGVGFHVGAAMAHPRMYHSIAMLLADGTVIVAGGADPNEHEPPLAYPDTWQGRTYLSTVRRIHAAPAGATTVQIDLGPSTVIDGVPLPEIPVGTLLVIDPGQPLEFVTDFVAQRLVIGPGGGIFVDLAAPLPNDFFGGTRIEFETAGATAPVPRKNEWLTIPPLSINRRAALSNPLNRKDYEIYEPPYMHKPGARPVLPPLKPGKVQVKYGATFTIATDDADRITRVAIMRPACVTHHTDTEQRYIELAFTKVDSTTLSATMVPGTDSSLAPPGYYMLWILAGDLPCVEARFIQLTGAPVLRTVPVPVEAAAPPSTAPTTTPTTTPATTPATSETSPQDPGGCPLAAAAGAIVPVGFLAAFADLTYLRSIRDELATDRHGARFVRLLSLPYYRAGRPLARYVAGHPNAASAVCSTVLAPTSASVRRAVRASRNDDGSLCTAKLVPLLSVVGVATLARTGLATVSNACRWVGAQSAAMSREHQRHG